MNRVFGFYTALSLIAASGTALSEEQQVIESYQDASSIFGDELYPTGFEKFYYVMSVNARGAHNIKHVFPAFWMTRAIGCCRRKTCRRSSDTFNRMESDLHNLYPTRVFVNSTRGSFPFGEVAGEDHEFAGCDFEEQAGIVEPRPAVHGEVARVVLHMAESYDAESGMPAGQIDLMRLWDAGDPPTAAERARNDLIESIQGTRNTFIDAHDASLLSPAPVPLSGDTEVDRVRIASWNIANLHFENDRPLPDRNNAQARSQNDFERLAAYVDRINPDILALQEVNGPEAVKRILSEEEYEIVVSDRFAQDTASGAETDHIYTAIAVRKDRPAVFIAGGTYEELSVLHDSGNDPHPTRAGSEVLVDLPNWAPLQVMSVHLKSGCHNGSLEPPRTEDCITLAKQREPLEAWVDELTEEDMPFIIAGDWNRRIDHFQQGDHVWGEIDDSDPMPLYLFRFPQGISSRCLEGTNGHFQEPIDFIFVDEQAARWADVESFRIKDFDPADTSDFRQVSDHCPVIINLIFPRS